MLSFSHVQIEIILFCTVNCVNNTFYLTGISIIPSRGSYYNMQYAWLNRNRYSQTSTSSSSSIIRGTQLSSVLHFESETKNKIQYAQVPLIILIEV